MVAQASSISSSSQSVHGVITQAGARACDSTRVGAAYAGILIILNAEKIVGGVCRSRCHMLRPLIQRVKIPRMLRREALNVSRRDVDAALRPGRLRPSGPRTSRLRPDPQCDERERQHSGNHRLDRLVPVLKELFLFAVDAPGPFAAVVPPCWSIAEPDLQSLSASKPLNRGVHAVPQVPAGFEGHNRRPSRNFPPLLVIPA